MSWIRDQTLSWLQRLSLMVLKSGPIPRHIAFIMDGNRRYAVKSNIVKAQGHSKGFDKLGEVLQWCLDMGVHEVTVYAFSIENFKRSKDEVDSLLDLARDKFRRLLEEKEKLKELGIRIGVIGNWNLMPKDIMQDIAEAILETRHNNRAVLNVAFAYTSREEITSAIGTVMRGVEAGELETKDMSEELISHCLYTANRPDPEILIRSSGESRLSDFLLWQTTNTFVYFVDILWPEFKFWHLWAAVFQYQRCVYTGHITALAQITDSTTVSSSSSNGAIASESIRSSSNGVVGDKSVSATTNKANARVSKFLENVNTAKVTWLEELWRSKEEHSKC